MFSIFLKLSLIFIFVCNTKKLILFKSFCLGELWFKKKKEKKKKPTANAGDIRGVGLIPVLERHPEEEIATHFSILARKISWTEEPGRL